jgi:hypothetical protein
MRQTAPSNSLNPDEITEYQPGEEQAPTTRPQKGEHRPQSVPRPPPNKDARSGKSGRSTKNPT